MSSKATEWAWEQPLDGRKKLLLLAIAHEANRSGACSLTQERLAEHCRCSVRQVRRMLKQLANERYVGRGSRRGALGGGRTSDLYVLPREARESNPDTHVRIGQNASKPDI
jgi:MarR-like DNA-binding transcriptional regulator SgrR of sgrS sRNA